MSQPEFMRRFIALLRKEVRQMLRDKSNLAVGLLLPIALILLFGYGLSFDVKNAPVAVVLEDSAPAAREAVAGLGGSSYLSPVWGIHMQEAERLLRAGEVDAIVRVPLDFSRRLAAGDARIQLILNGVNSTTAQTVEGYVNSAIATWAQKQADRAGNKPPALGRVEVVQRMWFNETGNSSWYLVPGLIVLVLTLIGAFLTSLLIAREWERGTLESLFVTPVRPLELIFAKLAPYLVVGAIDLVLCLLAARFLFEVPLRGSLPILFLASMLYLLVSLLLGLFISGKARNQFDASQLAMLVSFMPAMMLSGFVFDLRNMPEVLQLATYANPLRFGMDIVRRVYLEGAGLIDIWRQFIPLLVLAATTLPLAAWLFRNRLS